VNTPLGGEMPMAAVAVLSFNVHLTAVAATSTGDFTVVFVGTSDGHLRKVSKSYTRNIERFNQDYTIL
jgi:plexin A